MFFRPSCPSCRGRLRPEAGLLVCTKCGTRVGGQDYFRAYGARTGQLFIGAGVLFAGGYGRKGPLQISFWALCGLVVLVGVARVIIQARWLRALKRSLPPSGPA